MRAFMGLLVLTGLFLIAAAWQRSATDRVRAGREQRYGLPDPSAGRDGGWSLLVLGAISGAEPIEGADPPPAVTPPEGPDDPAEGPRPPAFSPDYRYEVQKGDVLGLICDRHYGTSRPALVEAVARYNDLASPDAIRAGDRLLLPDPGRLAD